MILILSFNTKNLLITFHKNCCYDKKKEDDNIIWLVVKLAVLILLCFLTGLHTRSVLDAIIESSRIGSWVRVDFVSNNADSDKLSVGSEEMIQITNEQQKENPDEKEHRSPVLQKMLTQ